MERNPIPHYPDIGPDTRGVVIEYNEEPIEFVPVERLAVKYIWHSRPELTEADYIAFFEHIRKKRVANQKAAARTLDRKKQLKRLTPEEYQARALHRRSLRLNHKKREEARRRKPKF